MNAQMRITVRVINAATQQLRQVEKDVAAVQSRMSRANSTASAGFFGGGGSGGLVKWGKNLQWTGRQIEYSFTLPLVAAGVAAQKWANENEAAFVRIQKVYGDASMSSQQVTSETNALRGAFRALSDMTGIAQKDILGIAGDWAAAGASGIALANATRLTAEAMILGEMSAQDTTKALIAIQAQYGLTTGQVNRNTKALQAQKGSYADTHYSVKSLADVIGVLNMVENQTGASFAGLVDGFERAAGTARTAGVDVRHLAAYIAALTPAAGSAAQAGNALKTIFSRLFAPTKQASDVLAQIGINTNSVQWNSKNANDRLIELARAFDKLNGSQKTQLSTLIASRFQISRFNVLMEALTNTNSYYTKALESTNSHAAVQLQYLKELGMVIQSQPNAFKILTARIQNSLAQAIIPLTPAIIGVLDAFSRLATMFSNLDPGIQKLILFGLATLALVGPILRYVGVTAQLIGELGGAFRYLFKGIGPLLGALRGLGGGALSVVTFLLGQLGTVAMASARVLGVMLVGSLRLLLTFIKGTFVREMGLTLGGFVRLLPAALGGPFGIAIAAVIILLIAFRDKLKGIFTSIGRFIVSVFNMLPQSIQNAFMAVIRVVAAAVRVVRDWLSELNPFKRHSPSIVDWVISGTAVIAQRYKNMAQSIATSVGQARNVLSAFKQATSSSFLAAQQLEFANDRKKVLAGAPAAAPQFDALTGNILKLQSFLPSLSRDIDTQQNVVDQWKIRLDAANDSLDAQQQKLDDLTKVQQRYQDSLSKDKDALDAWVNTPLQGMTDLNNQIYANDQATKSLQLQILKLQDAGQGPEDLGKKMQDLQGDLEALMGTASDLRAKGAGSDVLGPINDQIKAIQDSQKQVQGSINTVSDLQSQLDKLQQTGQELDLEKSLKIDPLTHQIELLTSTAKELPFDEIIAGVKATQAAVIRDQAAYDQATQAVDRQQAAVDRLKDVRDAIQRSYDNENNLLSKLKDEYSTITQTIQDMQGAIDDLTSSLDKQAAAAKGASDAVDAFNAAGLAGDFPDPGGMAQIGREGGAGDQTSQIDDLAKQWEDESRKMFGGLDIFGPFKDMWSSAVKWIDDHTGGAATKIVNDFKANSQTAIAGAGLGAMLGAALGGPFGAAIGGILGGFIGAELPKYKKQIQSALQGIGDGLKSNKGLTNFMGGIGDFFEKVAHWVTMIADLVRPAIEQIGKIVGEKLIKYFKMLANNFKTWGDTIQPVLEILHALWTTIKVLLIPMVALLILTFEGWWPVIKNTIGPAFDLMISIIDASLKVLHGIIDVMLGLITGDWSLAWDGIRLIFSGFLEGLVASVVAPFKFIWGYIKGILEGIENIFKWLYDVLIGHSIVPDIVNGVKFMFMLWATLPIWIFNNVLRPIWNFFVTAWNALLKPAVNTITDGIRLAFFGLLGIVKWLSDNIIGPIGNAFQWLWNVMLKPVLNGIARGMATIWNGVGHAIASGINIGIDAIDKLIDGINWVTSHLHLGSPFGHIDHVTWKDFVAPQLARGGMIEVGNGFKTNGPRAIVGEGSPNHPEFVIPTDPRYRTNARALYKQLSSELGVPGFFGGGVIDFAKNAANAVSHGAEDVWNAGVKGLGYIRKGVVTAAFAPYLKAVDILNSHTPNDPYPARSIISKAKNDLYNWVKGKDNKDRNFDGSDYTLATIPGSIGGALGNAIQAIEALGNRGPQHVITSEFRPGAGYHGTGNAVDFGFPGNNPAGLTPIARYWEQFGPGLLELIYSGDGGHFWKNGRKVGFGFYGAATESEHYNHVHVAATLDSINRYLNSVNPQTAKAGRFMGGGVLPWMIPGLANGGIVYPRPGGTVVRLGEAGQREAVVPLPSKFNDLGSGEIHFHGDLIFPNVKSGEDAEDFITNLKVMAGGRKGS